MWNGNWKRTLMAAALLIALALPLSRASAEAAPAARPAPSARAVQDAFEREWYDVFIGASRVGYACVRTSADPPADAPAGTVLESGFELNVEMRRAGFATKMVVDSSVFETASGRPVRTLLRKETGQFEVVEEMYFRGEWGDRGVDYFTRQLGEVRHQLLPSLVTDEARASGGAKWLTARQATRHVTEAIKKGEKRIEYWTLDPSAGARLLRTRMDYEGEAELEVGGAKIKCQRWRQSVDGQPALTTTVYMDGQGETRQMEVAMLPGMTMRMVRSDASTVRAKVDELDMFRASLLHSDRAIPDARKLRRMVLEMDVARDTASPALGASGFQRVSAVASGEKAKRLRVEVDLDQPVWVEEGSEQWPTDDHRRASVMVDFEEGEVAALVKRAVGGAAEAPPLVKARAIRGFVHDFITRKDYSVGFASASEVARTRRGDCTEHGVLTAALLRGAGVPSRVVTGLIYVPALEKDRDVFVFHMWAQAWLEEVGPGGRRRGRWIDMDATLPDGAEFDAAHVALGASTLSSFTPADNPGLQVSSMGPVKLRVIEPKE